MGGGGEHTWPVRRSKRINAPPLDMPTRTPSVAETRHRCRPASRSFNARTVPSAGPPGGPLLLNPVNPSPFRKVGPRPKTSQSASQSLGKETSRGPPGRECPGQNKSVTPSEENKKKQLVNSASGGGGWLRTPGYEPMLKYTIPWSQSSAETFPIERNMNKPKKIFDRRYIFFWK